ncbi:MAG: polysaccharide biosynthesis tyrosine autokinase [Armatimonadota bacterium]|nr:polysaccharide biosynthesis tyrosine autokinase [Armatimonadota bacterium]
MHRDRSVLAQLTDILSRRRAYALSCFALVLLGTAIVTFTATPVYRAKAIVQIEQPSGFVLRTDLFGAGFTRTLPQEQAEMLDTYPYKALVDSIVIISQNEGILLSQYKTSENIRALFEDILCKSASSPDVEGCILSRAAQIERRAPGAPKEEEEFQQDIRARLVEDTGLIELFAEASSPRRAQNAANAAAVAIVWQNERLRKEEARNTVRFIREQLEAPGGVKQQLAEADERLASFKRKEAFLDAGEQVRALMLQMVELSNRQWQGNLRLTDLRTRLAATRLRLGQEPSTLVSPTIYENPTVQEIKKQLVIAEADLLALQAQFTDEHPRVQSAVARVEALREQLRQEASRIESVQRLPNPVYQELYKNIALLSADIVGQEAQMSALQRTLGNVRQQMLAVPELEKQLTQLLRQRQALERRYLFLIERLQEAELTQAVKLGNARVVELAQLPGKRVKPRRILNMLMGTVLGALIAIGFALLLEQIDRRLPSAEQASAWLGAPLLCSIPVVREGAEAPLLKEPVAVEAFRNLRAAIRLSTQDRPVRVLMVGSPLPGEGKTFVARHLATSMAHSGQRVLLIDADLRLPTQHRFDGVPQSPGLVNILSGENPLDECLRGTGIENLWLLPAGAAPPNPTELLESVRMQGVLAQLRERYDMLILDAPPVEMFADSRLLALYSDAILLVVQPGSTPRDAALHAVETLHAVPGARLLGIVANKVPVSTNAYTPYYPSIRRRGL